MTLDQKPSYSSMESLEMLLCASIVRPGGEGYMRTGPSASEYHTEHRG